jgi:hypothetical protein
MKRAQANINDSHNKYLSDLSRIADVRYVPTEYDILISRVRTTQITAERYMIESIEFLPWLAGDLNPLGRIYTIVSKYVIFELLLLSSRYTM